MTVMHEETELRPRQALRIPGKHLSLTTYRRDGTPVSTPVWFVEEDGRLFVITAAHSYKARRLRRNSAALVVLILPIYRLVMKLRGRPLDNRGDVCLAITSAPRGTSAE